MGGYDGSGSLFALGMRVTKLDTLGKPLVGANNAYYTDALVNGDFQLTYNEPDAVEQLNGQGAVCVYYQPPSTVKGLSIGSLKVCQPDPNIMSFLAGGAVYQDTANPANQIGYQAPAVGGQVTPNGVSLELWTRAIKNGAYAGSLPYLHWVFPRVFLKWDQKFALNATEAMTPEFTGDGTENVNWGDGPDNKWLVDSSRVFQYLREATAPPTTPGFQTVSTDLTATSIAVAPTTQTLSLAGTKTKQLAVTATMSDATTRDVTYLYETTYASADATKVTVGTPGNASDGGLMTGIATGGPINVTATYRGQTGSCAVTVTA